MNAPLPSCVYACVYINYTVGGLLPVVRRRSVQQNRIDIENEMYVTSFVTHLRTTGSCDKYRVL